MFSKATFLRIFVLCMATTTAQTKIDPNGSWRIMGGSPAADGAHPYQVSLRVYGEHAAGGVIIAKEWVITSCDRTAGPLECLTVVVGSNRLTMGGHSYRVLEVHCHDGKYDAAILKVEPMNFTEKVAAIALDTEYIGDNEYGILSGWGFTGGDDDDYYMPPILPDKLQEITLRTSNKGPCESSTDEIFFCAVSKKGIGASCFPDAGGPFTRKVGGIRKLIGIATITLGCNTPGPDFFLRVSSFIPWYQEKCNNCFN